jgi:3-deoxy-D-manno-octulosonic acid (KDO) 8-phosphate synthase
MLKQIKIGRSITLGNGRPLVFIAGPCVIESATHPLRMAEKIAKIAEKLRIPYVFKASYDKANRSSVDSYRGPGLEKGLRILEKVKKETGLPILTDVHSIEEIKPRRKWPTFCRCPRFSPARRRF